LKEFWDERYAEKKLAYGEQPNAFVKEYLEGKTPGAILFPAEGQGRNAIFAAKKGWKVDAFDYSSIAMERAQSLAKQAGVSINYSVQDMLEYEPPEHKYDVIFLVYVHLKPEWRSKFYPKLLKALKPNGILVMEAFTKTQLAYQHLSGGPANEMLLYTADIVRNDFRNLEEVYLEEMKTELNEGKYHIGPAHIIRYIGRQQST